MRNMQNGTWFDVNPKMYHTLNEMSHVCAGSYILCDPLFVQTIFWVYSIVLVISVND